LACLLSFVFIAPVTALADASANGYMLKLVNDGTDEQGIWKEFGVTEGKTYSISFNYYNNGSVCRFRIVRSDFGNLGICRDTVAAVTGRFYYEYTASETTDVIFIIDNGLYDGTSNVWNISVTEKGTTENLLSNANFENGDLGWWNGDSRWCNAVAFDNSAWNVKTNMVKIVNDGTTNDQAIYQGVYLTEGVTYTFSFNYYTVSGAIRFKLRNCNFSQNLLDEIDTSTGCQGRKSVQYTATYTGLHIPCYTNGYWQGTSYIWNISCTEADNTNNLITNPNFLNGSFSGWSNSNTDLCTMQAYSDSAWNKREYMVKIVNDGNNDQAIYQGVYLTKGETYTFSFDYYSQSGAIRFRLRNYNFSQILHEVDTVSGWQGTITVDYTATYTGLHIPCYTNGFWQGTSYIWNVKCTEKGSTENLLTNSNFLNGSLAGWDGNKDLCTTVAYNDKLWSGDYMLELTNDGTNNQGIWQFVPVVAGKQYTISFDYYSNGASARVWLSEGGPFNGTKIEDTSIDVKKTFTMDYTAGSTGNVNFILTNGFSVGKVYLWNLKFYETGSNVNMLSNPDFYCGSGYCWDCNNGYCNPVAFDSSLWEVEPDDYMLKIVNDGENIWQGFYQGFNAEENTDYVFSFDYYAVGGAFEGRICGNTFNNLRSAGIADYSKGSISIEYNRGTEPTGSGGNPALGIVSIDNANLEGTLYVWNIKLVKKGESENLLVNPYFLNGKSAGWTGNSKCYSIIEFDASVYAALVELDLDLSGAVTIDDMIELCQAFLTGEHEFDINGDKVFNLLDFVSFKKKYINYINI